MPQAQVPDMPQVASNPYAALATSLAPPPTAHAAPPTMYAMPAQGSYVPPPTAVYGAVHQPTQGSYVPPPNYAAVPTTIMR